MKAKLPCCYAKTLSVQTRANDPAEFGAFVAAEMEKWGKVVRTANIKAEYARSCFTDEVYVHYGKRPPVNGIEAMMAHCRTFGRICLSEPVLWNRTHPSWSVRRPLKPGPASARVPGKPCRFFPLKRRL